MNLALLFKTARRNLRKNKLTTGINLLGLSVGITAAVFIFLWVQNETGYDNFYRNKKHIYRITNSIQVNQEKAWVWETSPLLLSESASKEIPGVSEAAILRPDGGTIVFKVNNQLFTEKNSAWVNKAWFRMFDYQFLKGRQAAFGDSPFDLVLTQSQAVKYFGARDPIGKFVQLDSVNYTVTGVVADNPVNSSFQFDLLLNVEGRLANPRNLQNDRTWNNFNYISFLQLDATTHVAQAELALNRLLNKHQDKNNDLVSLRPLAKLYFEDDLQASRLPHGSRKVTWIFGILGCLLLLIACINYMNLTTAQASVRAREISIRKIVGATRRHLVIQFLFESLLITLLALGITLLLIKLCLPLFNAVTEKPFKLPLTSITTWQVLLGTLLAATVLNGIYPAILLSSFNPLNVFKGKTVLHIKDALVRKVLVIFQFTLSMLLIIATLVIYNQLTYIQATKPGYDMEQVMTIHIPYKVYKALDNAGRAAFFAAIRQDLRQNTSILDVSSAGEEIVNVGSSSSGNADWDGRDTSYNPSVAVFSADPGFAQMFRLQMVAGKWFREGTEDQHSYILNETAARQFQMRQPLIGQRFTWGGDTGQLIGVVKDFHFKSLHEMIGPLVISNNHGADGLLFIKTAPGTVQKAIAATESTWKKFVTDQPFSYNFLDDSFNNLYKSDIKVSRLLLIFSIIAVLISALGLFGLAVFTAANRAREIGIRKVMGASVAQVASLLSGEFVKLVLIACAIAIPLGSWIMQDWLEDFAYRTSVSLWILAVAASTGLTIALLSVSVQAIRAARSNPAKTLRTQ